MCLRSMYYVPSKSINIDTRLYERLKQLKGKESFSVIIRKLLEEREHFIEGVENADLKISPPRITRENSLI